MMLETRKVMVILGTRPEAVKLAPVIGKLSAAGCYETIVLSTAQHRDMLDQVLNLFGITPRYDLNIMTENQNIVDVTSACLHGVDAILKKEKPHLALVQGDTTTVFAAALACYYNRIPIGHVEAGLRTADKFSPFPEEANRRLASVLADLHFAPTDWGKENLVREGVPAEQVFVTGNTVVDALLDMASRSVDPSGQLPQLPAFLAGVRRYILVTAHRRESFGKPFGEMCRAMRDIVDINPDVGIIYPVHPNPNVRQKAREMLGGHPRILLLEPLDYVSFVHLMKGAYLVLTDSGGVQEEAPSLGKPVLIMRDKTERPEGVAAGVTRLVGTGYEGIFASVTLLLTSIEEYRSMASGRNPFGDGMAAQRIVDIIGDYFSEKPCVTTAAC